MERQRIKHSEARILVYLSVVRNDLKHVTAINGKLKNDYSYTMRVLQAMVEKGWLLKHKYKRHVFYDLTKEAPLEDAKMLFNSDVLQTELNQYREIESPENSPKNNDLEALEAEEDKAYAELTKGDDDDTENQV
jgi:DNA-binding MarR family transcriptional regulator